MLRKKIIIIGPPGSGKSTLAEQLGRITELPVHYLDQYFFDPGWQAVPYDTFLQRLRFAMAQQQWIIEGSSIKTIPERIAAADIIILLNIPRYLCFWRIFKRENLSDQKDLCGRPLGCSCQISWKFTKYIWQWHQRFEQEIRSTFEQAKFDKLVYELKSSAQVAEFLKSFQETYDNY